MKIVAVETVRVDDFPEFTAVRLHTDEGLVGLGETCFGPEAVEAYVHESVAGRLIGTDPLRIARHAKDLPAFYVTHGGTGVSTRAHSAVDLALWDLLGKSCGKPLYQLIGGRFRERAPIYNTCGGYHYGRAEAKYRGTSRGLGDAGVPAPKGPYEDLEAFQHRAGELAESLLAEGIAAMKIWPFDEVARANGGQSISLPELAACLEPLDKIRAAVGDSMEVMIELHGLWEPMPAARICAALEPYRPRWVEDAIELDGFDGLKRLREATSVPLAFGETIGNLHDFKRLFDTGATDVVLFDFGWSGGITEALRVGALAAAYQVPIAPHDCVGPLALCVGAHVSVALGNVVIQETVRAYYTDWYREIVSGLPSISDGFIVPSEEPGIGAELLEGLTERPDAHVRMTT